MNKLLAIVTLSICIVIASTSHLDARSDAPPASTRSRGSNNHYQLPQQKQNQPQPQQSLHNRKSQSALHSRNATTTSTTAKTTKLTATNKLDTGDSSRTIDGGVGGSTGGRPLRLRRLSYDDSRQQQQHHRRNSHRTGRNFEGRRSGGGSGGASLSPSNPSWQSRYNTNNVRTYSSNNGHGHPRTVVASAVGKDDIMRDVENINENDLNSNDWLPRAEPEFVTLPPPTTTTTTMMTTTSSTTTEGPYGTGSFSRKNGFDGRVDPKVLESRHICVQQRALLVPVKTVEVYNRPMWKHISHPCPAQTNQSNQMCTRVQLVHEPAYRDIIRHKTTKQMVYDCCPGWSRITKSSNACMKPICSGTCRNGGTCIGPEACSCPPGYGGKYCEKDINECNEEKPCDQLCYNTDGSFYCQCREGFVLQSDKQSCKKIDNNDDDAFEARDLENEIDSNEVTSRLHKIEKSLANERITTNELQKSLEATYTVVDSLKNRLLTLEKQQQDMNHLHSNLVATETRTRKLENMISVLFKCRNSPGPYCP
ncbi:uncharacterized protein LOC129912579 [Episyrphus balteatus]|uniref:uncharacterized protein LOC129912579 n=1 Tax=Episyrphus balteatus TaxID=286459 RepID=UPI0024863705|nr:uncharacterized protein LOC129912579 [Episyrphus balteatus]